MAGIAVSPAKKHDYWVAQWNHRTEYYRQENELYGHLIAFSLDQKHYKRDRAPMDNDSSRIQPKGQQLTNLIRHKQALLMGPPISFEARPVQPIKDAMASIISHRIIEEVVEDPKRRYRMVEARMILSGLAGARGTVAIEWDHATNGVVLRNSDPRKLMHTPGYLDLHDPRTPDVIEEVPMRLSVLKRMGWKVPADLTADNKQSEYASSASQDSHEIDWDASGSASASIGDGTNDDGIVTILKCYSRRDPFQQTRRVSVPVDLPQERWYWTNDAGERVPMMDSPEQPGDGFRLVTKDEDARDLELFSGGYLCIIAPFYGGKKPLWEGTWLPDAANSNVKLRSFPFMDYAPYLHPLKRAGLSDTQMLHSLQIIDNASLRAAWEQMRSAQTIMTVMRGSLFDAQNRPFVPSDKPLQIAYATDRLGLEGIGFHNAPGMNAALPQFRNMLSESWSHMGTGDVSMPAQRSRDIAVGTIQAMQESGDLPVQMHREILHCERAIALGVILDYTRAYRSDAELVQWVGDDGELVSASVRGSDLIDVNVRITASADAHTMDSDRMQAIAQFAGQMAAFGPQVGPALMAALAPLAGIPPEAVRSIQAVVGQAAQQTAPQGMPAGPGVQGAPPAMQAA